eukprot:SAG31_NODE_538_length_14312_cov_12.542461_14_plen_470_part_00
MQPSACPTFSYVFLPADRSSPAQLCIASGADHFATDANGQPTDALPPQLQNSDVLGTAGGEIEKFVLLRPSNSSQNTFVTIYGGQHMLDGQAQVQPNRRATALAMECGRFAIRLHGDVCVGRLRREPGSIMSVQNVDFDLDDAHFDAAWTADAAQENYLLACGLLMSAFSNRSREAETRHRSVHQEYSGCVPSVDCHAQNESADSVNADSTSGSEVDGSSDDSDWEETEEVQAIRKKLEIIYAKYRPEYVDRIDELLLRHYGEEEKLLKKVMRKYTGEVAVTFESDCLKGFCFNCQKPAEQLCRCKGVFWCSQQCAELCWSHDCLCEKWAQYSARSIELAAFPGLGEWTHLTTAEQFEWSEEPYANFLHSMRLAGHSWWITELKGWIPGYCMSSSILTIDPETVHSMQSGLDFVAAGERSRTEIAGSQLVCQGDDVDSPWMAPSEDEIDWQELGSRGIHTLDSWCACHP